MGGSRVDPTSFCMTHWRTVVTISLHKRLRRSPLRVREPPARNPFPTPAGCSKSIPHARRACESLTLCMSGGCRSRFATRKNHDPDKSLSWAQRVVQPGFGYWGLAETLRGSRLGSGFGGNVCFVTHESSNQGSKRSFVPWVNTRGYHSGLIDMRRGVVIQTVYAPKRV